MTVAHAEGEEGKPPPDPGTQCRTAIQAEERAHGIPEYLMVAIGLVETGRQSGNGRFNPWPWSINVEGTDHVYESKQAVIDAVRSFQAKGMRSIDVGCMQVNLVQHPAAFASLDEAFDPMVNARYAARFLVRLRQQTGTWDKAAAWYHSATPPIGEAYRRRVMAIWPGAQRRAEDRLHENLVAAWGATLPGARPGAGLTAASEAAHLPARTSTAARDEGGGTGAAWPGGTRIARQDPLPQP